MRAPPDGATESGGKPASQPFPDASTVPRAQLKSQLGGRDYYNASEAATGRQLTSQLHCVITGRPISLVLVAF